jgi:hypothetical protein
MANQLEIISGNAYAARRFADALLRSEGDTEVTIRISNPSSGDTSSQLGLEPLTASDMPLSPSLVKALKPTADGKRQIEAVISAVSLETIAKQYDVPDIVDWLRREAQGVVYHDTLMRIDTITVDKFLGADCLYHITATE